MKTIKLANGQETLVDDSLFEELSKYSWHVSSKGYVRRTEASGSRYGRKTIYMAVQVMGFPTDVQVDHIDGNKLNNQQSNLRFVTNGMNCQNRIQANNKTGYIGVSFKSTNNKYVAQISCNGEKKHLGLFSDPMSAALAYDKAALELFGPNAKTNF